MSHLNTFFLCSVADEVVVLTGGQLISKIRLIEEDNEVLFPTTPKHVLKLRINVSRPPMYMECLKKTCYITVMYL